MTTREEQEAIWTEVYARLTPDQRRVADDISKRAQDRADQQLQWAEELVALADILTAREAGAAPWPVVRLFWVRLHGVVTELIEQHRSTVELANAMTERELARNLMRFSVAIFNAATAILTILEESEVVVADYLRQRAAHLRQDSYAVRATKAGVRDTRRIDHIGKDFTIEEVDRMRDDVLRMHGSDAGFARHLAVKTRSTAVRLLEALRALRQLPPM